jgi:hypothetical protein
MYGVNIVAYLFYLEVSVLDGNFSERENCKVCYKKVLLYIEIGQN